MDESAFENLFAGSLRKYPRRFAFREPPSLIDSIELAENEMGVIFPRAYRTFLKVHGSGEIAFALVYSPEPQRYWSIVDKNVGIPNRENFYAFSDDQCGNFYGFSRHGGDEVHVFDHEIDVWSITRYKDFYDYFADIAFRE
jgi:hypothetical protein